MFPHRNRVSRHTRLGLSLALATGAMLLVGRVRAQPPPPDAEQKTVRIQRTAEPPTIDGELNEEVWVRAPLVDDFHQVSPVEGDAPSERTEVYVLYDRDALYIAARMFDAEPELINARILRQGQNINSDDRFFVHIDPFNSRRSGYLFGVNPNGVRYDGTFEGVTQRQFDWDGIWQAAARITPEGWVLEIAIPFKTLSFDPSTTTWRMNFARNIARKNEGMAWLSRNRNTDLSSMGDVTGISQIEQGRGLDVVPSMSVRDRRAIGTVRGESAVEPSVDVFYKITPQLNAALTLNTDFSATEVDDRQVNLSRFSLFFPERRDFFLNDADIFQFGRLQQDGRPFFSRRLGIGATGEPVPLDVGTRVSGRIGRFDVGTLAVRQEAYDNPFASGGVVDATTAFVGRVSANVLEESSVGMIMTRGNPSSNLDNSVAGVDFRYLNSQLIRGKSLEGDAWFQQSDSEGLVGGDDTAFGVGVRLPSNSGFRGEAGYHAHRAELQSGVGLRAPHGHRGDAAGARAYVAPRRPRDPHHQLRRERLAHRQSRRRNGAEPKRQPASAEYRLKLAGRLRHQHLEPKRGVARAVHGVARRYDSRRHLLVRQRQPTDALRRSTRIRRRRCSSTKAISTTASA